MIVDAHHPFLLSYNSPSDASCHSETLLFVHGLDSSKETWNPVVNSLKDKYRIFSVDLRGHGETPLGKFKEFSLELLAEDINCFVREKKLERFTLVGHSMGVRVVIAYASKYPERVGALVLVDMELLPRDRRDLEEEAVLKLLQFRKNHATESGALEELLNFGYEKSKFDSWKSQGKIKITTDNGCFIGFDPYASYLTHNAVQANEKAAEMFSKLGKEKIPILLMVAEDESSTTEVGISQMKGAAPAMKVVRVEGSKHAIHKTQTARFINELFQFINQSKSF